MKRYENLYAGLTGRYLVGGVNLDKVKKSGSDLEVWDGETKVGFVSRDVLLMTFKERKDGEKT